MVETNYLVRYEKLQASEDVLNLAQHTLSAQCSKLIDEEIERNWSRLINSYSTTLMR